MNNYNFVWYLFSILSSLSSSKATSCTRFLIVFCCLEAMPVRLIDESKRKIIATKNTKFEETSNPNEDESQKTASGKIAANITTSDTKNQIKE